MESKICRVCLDRTATINLFDKDEIMQYCDKIMKCVTVVIEEGDGLPDAICDNCASELSISYEFAQKCEASDRALRCLGLLQTPDLKEEDFKTEIKDEPNSKDEVPEDPEYAEEPLEPLDDVNEYLSDLKEDLKTESTFKNDFKKKRQLQEKPLPIYLRKIKNRVYSGPIQCMVCGRLLKCRSAYEGHMRTHTKEKPFSCDLCRKCFRTKSSMKLHIMKHYGIDDRENRKLRPLPDGDGRRKLNIFKSSPILCMICQQKLDSHSALAVHMRKHTGDKPFKCPDCSKSYSLKGSLVRHIEVNHTKVRCSKFVCEQCGKNFHSKSNIIVHLRIHTGEKPYACPFCGERFVQQSSLIRHKRCHTGEKPFSCHKCAKTFRDRSILNKHQLVHSDTRDFICHICSKALKTKQALRGHIERHNNPERFICNFCGQTFTVKGNLNLHVSRIHSEKSGVCTVCNKSFSDLPAHMRVHSGEKPFVCKLCNKGFATQRTLSHHMGFRHRNSAKFKCTTGQCDKAFPLISMLEFHVLKTHLETTPYVCQHCARGFLRPCDLSRHLKLNHMDHTRIKSQFIKTVLQINNT